MSAARLIVGIIALLLASGSHLFPAALAASDETAPAPLPIEIVPPTQHTLGLNSAVFSHDLEDRFIATSGDDGVIKLWDARTGRLIRNLVRIDPNKKYWRVKSLSSDGRRLLGIVGGEYKVWDTLTGREVLSIPYPSDAGDEDAVFMSRDGSRIAVMRGDKTVKLFDAQNGK